MFSFEVHSNESACRQSGQLRLEQVSNLRLNRKENSKTSTVLIKNRDREQKRFINLNWTSEASNPNRKCTRADTTSKRRLLMMKSDSLEASLKDITY